MITHSLYSIIFVILLFLITACKKSNEAQPPTSIQPASAVITGQAKSHPITASEILAAFRKDISVCTSAMKILENDRAFIDEFTPAINRESKSLDVFLRQSSFATTEDVQYILANLKYFFIDLDNHGNMMAVAWVGNTGIFCAPSFLRLDDIEALGESPEAWEVRANFLERELANLIPTGSVASDSEEQFKYFKEDVEKTSRLYSSTQRPKFITWVKKAITHIEMDRNTLTTEAGLTIEEQNKIIDNKVGFLQGFVGQPHTEPSGVMHAK